MSSLFDHLVDRYIGEELQKLDFSDDRTANILQNNVKFASLLARAESKDPKRMRNVIERHALSFANAIGALNVDLARDVARFIVENSFDLSHSMLGRRERRADSHPNARRDGRRATAPSRSDPRPWRQSSRAVSLKAASTQHTSRRPYAAHPNPASPAQTPPGVQDCSICGETKLIRQFPYRPLTRACSHGMTVCTCCVQQWIASQLNSNGVNQPLTCAQCRAEMMPEDVKRSVPPETYCRYKRLLDQARRNNTKPSPSQNPRLDSGHRSRHFRGYGPRDQQSNPQRILERQRQEAESQTYIRNTTKPCPRCSTRIAKIEGCDHMTCAVCRHEFCWLCGASHSTIAAMGNHLHRVDCPHYRRLEPLYQYIWESELARFMW